MNKTLLSQIEKMLNEQKNEILNRSLIDRDIDMDGDETDEMQGEYLAFVNNQLSGRDKDKLNKINNALLRIKDGSFGKCEECGDEISEKRLLFNPSFITCISCAEELEMLAKKR